MKKSCGARLNIGTKKGCILFAEKQQCNLVVEATNFYETSVANTLKEALLLLDFSDSRCLHILPDSFHMNIMEKDYKESLLEAFGKYDFIHLSDNNRFLPGFGGIDFQSFINYCNEIGFEGGFVLEGKVKDHLIKDLEEVVIPYLNTIQGL